MERKVYSPGNVLVTHDLSRAGESLVAEENEGEKSQSSSQSKTKKKNSSGIDSEGGKISIVGMGGVGEISIVNNSPVNMTFGNIRS